MRSTRTTSPRRLATALVAALAAVPSAPAARAQDSFRGWEEMKDPSFKFDPDHKVFRNYQPRASANVRELLDHWRKLLSENAPVPALRSLQQVIDDFGAYVYQVAEDRYAGAAEWARYELMSAPAAVRAAYESYAEQSGRGAFLRAVADRDEAALRTVARRYANASVGQEALLALARFARERGARDLAAMTARRALDFLATPAPGREAKAAQLVAEAEAIAALCEGKVEAPPPASARLDVAGFERPLSEFLAGTPLAPRKVRDDTWPTYGGDAQRVRLMEPPRRPLALKDGFDLPVENSRFPQSLSPFFAMRHDAVQPIRLGDRLYVNNTLSVKCFDLLGRTLVWEYESAQSKDPPNYVPVTEYSPNDGGGDEPTHSKALISGLSAADGIVLANLMVPQQVDVKTYQRFRINDPCPWRGLVALDADTGAVLWEQRPFQKRGAAGERRDASALLARLDVAAPPAIVDDVVFALGNYIEGGVNSYLVALELKTGRLIYAVPLAIGQQELSMFNMPFQEFTAGMPGVLGGTIFCSTNLGLLAAVDAVFGDLRWLAAYDALPITPPENYFRNRPRSVYWYNRGPLCANGLCLVTPHDSQKLFAYESATGKLRWEVPLRSHERNVSPNSWLLGATGGRAIVVNGGMVVAVDLESGRLKWVFPSEPGARPLDVVGSGGVTAGEVWIPTDSELLVLDVSAGSVREQLREPWGQPDRAGNLLVFPDMLVTATRSTVTVNFDPAEALATLEAERGRRGDSLELLARIGSLQRQAGDYDLAAATLEKALEFAAGAPPDLVARTRAVRCDTLRDAARARLAIGKVHEAEAALVAAEKIADDADSRTDVVRTLLAQCVTDLKDARAFGWLARLRDDFAGARVLIPELSPRPVALGIWVALETARRREACGAFPEALVELQRVESEYPSEPLLEKDSATVAQKAVDALLARAGPELRKSYDADAERTFAAAADAGDAARLGLLLRRFPSASSAPKYAAKELELLRTTKKPDEAIAVGAELLRAQRGGALTRAALAEVARSARDLGNTVLARTLVARLSRGADADALPEDLAPLAHEEPAPPSTGGGSLDVLGSHDVDESGWLFGSSEHPIKGQALDDDLGGVLLKEPGAQLAISLLKLPALERAWTVTPPRPRMNEGALHLIHSAGVLLVRRGSEFIAYDVRDGTFLWARTFDRVVQDFGATGGVVLVSLSTPSRDASEPVPAALVGLEPRSGAELFNTALAGTETHGGQLLAQGDLCAVSSNSRTGLTVEVLDIASGARRLEPKTYTLGTTLPLLLPDAGLVALPAGNGVANRLGGVARLVAWRLEDGEQAFEYDLLPMQYKLRWTLPVAEGIAIYGGQPPNARVAVVDPRSGQAIGEPLPLPNEVADTSRPIRVVGEEARARVLGFTEFRRGGEFFNFTLVAGDGRPLWKQTYDVPKNTVLFLSPDRLFRKGGALLFTIWIQYGGKCCTDLLVVDEASGRLLDRKDFEGGRPAPRDDLVRSGDAIVLRQDTKLHVLAWR